MTHPEDELILRYVAGGGSEAEGLEVDEHMADCAACFERIRTLLYLRENFEPIWASWTAGEHGRALRLAQVASALVRAARCTPSLAERAKAWLARLGGAAEIGLRVLVDRAQRLATLAAGSLPAGNEFVLQSAVSGVGSPEEVAALKGHLDRSTALLSEGQADAAREELRRAGRIDARSAQAAVSEVKRGGDRFLRICAEARRGEIAIQAWPRESCPMPGIALLIPRDAPDRSSAALFEGVEGESYWVAEFGDLPDGVSEVFLIPGGTMG